MYLPEKFIKAVGITYLMVTQRSPGWIRQRYWKIRARESAPPAVSFGRKHITEKYSFALRQIKGTGTVADIGTGTGYGIVSSGDANRFVGLDYNKHALKLGELEHPELKGKLIHGNALQTDKHFKNLSGITAFEILEHLRANEKRVFLESAKRALVPSGVLVMSTPLSFRPRTLNIYHFGKELEFEEFTRLVEEYFPNTIYYGIGILPKSISKRYAERVHEAVSSADIFHLRRLLSKNLRSKFLSSISGKQEIHPIAEYLKKQELPKNIISVSTKD